AKVRGKLLQHAARWRDQVRRQGLALVEDNHAPGDVVQLAAAAGFVAEQALKELHVGRDDDRRIPVLSATGRGLERRLVSVLIAGRLGQAVMLENEWIVRADTQSSSQDAGVLLQDGHVRG